MKQQYTKWLFFLIGVLVSSQQVSAQIFSENFAPGSLVSAPSNPVTSSWYEQLRLESNRNRWTFKSGEAYLKKENNGYNGTVEAWLVSQEINLKAGSNVLTFDEKQSGVNNNGSIFSIRISTTSQSDMDGFSLIKSYSEVDFSTTYTSHTIDLSDFAGQSIYIAFVRRLVSTQGDDWYLDNVAMNGSEVEEAADFRITNITNSQIDLSWTRNASNDSVLIAWSSDGNFGPPVELTTYAQGDPIAGGGTVLYYGDVLTSHFHTSLSEFTPYYYKVWSVNGEVAYSYAGVTANATTIGESTIEYADFEDGNDGWTLGGFQWWPNDDWVIGSDQFYRGSQSAYVSANGTTAAYSNNYSGAYIALSKTIPLSNVYKSAELSFFWKAGGVPSVAYGEVRIDGELVGSIQQYQGQPGWREQIIDITEFLDPLNPVVVNVEFRWSASYNPTSNNPGFCIDDIRITGSTVEQPNSLNASVSGVSNIQLSWNKNSSGDAILVAYSPDGNFGSPVKGSIYSAESGDVLPGGGTVIYNSDVATSYLHAPPVAGAAYYKAWSVNTAQVYSASIGTSASLPVTLPFFDDFEGDVSSWSLGNNQYHEWLVGRAVKDTGEKSGYVSVDNGISASYENATGAGGKNVEIKVPVNFKGFIDANISFRWLCNALSNNIYGRVLIDGTDVSTANYWGQPTVWQDGSIDITSAGILNDVREIKFQMYYGNGGTGGSNPGFCIDNVYITGTIYPVASFAAVNPNSNSNLLDWIRSTDRGGLDEVIIAYSKGSDVAGAPVTGAEYVVGDELPGGGTILYVGTDVTTKHNTLDLNTTYYYKIWHKSGFIYSTTALSANATTPLNIGFFDDFENDGSGYKASWTYGTSGGNNIWFRGEPVAQNVTAFSGNEFAFITNDAGITAQFSKPSATEIDILHLNDIISLSGLNNATLSFYYKGDDLSGVHYGQVYVNSTLFATYNAAESAWTKAAIDVSSELVANGGPGTINVEFRWTSTKNIPSSGIGWCIDNVALYGAYDNTSTLAAGAAVEPSIISSLCDDESSAIRIMDFTITDGGSGDEQSTIVHEISLRPGDLNTITDYTQVIGGAYIVENGQTTGKVYANVNATSLVFNQEDLLTVADGAATTYDLFVWLKTPMDINGDDLVLDLDLDVEDIVAYNGSGFDSAPTVITNDAMIEVIATELQFTTEPSRYAQVNMELSTTPVVSAVDANGNRDVGYGESITLSSSLTVSGNVISADAGQAAFSNLTFTQSGGPVIVTAGDGSLSGTFENITVYDYCEPEMVTNTKYITLVRLNQIDNYSINEGTSVVYKLDQSTNLSRGVTYTLTIGTASASGDVVKVWIDWDQVDGFDEVDDSEMYTFGTVTSNNQTLTKQIVIPADAKLGATRMRVMLSSNNKLAACDPDDIDDNANGESEDYTVIITNNEWLGYTPTWDVASNWSSGAVPSAMSDNVTIGSALEGNYYPIISSNIELGNVEIQSNGRITVNEGIQVSVSDLHNDGALVLKSRQDNMSSFINTSLSGMGQAQTVMYFPSRRWWYAGHAVDGATSADYNAVDPGAVQVWNWNSSWSQITDNSTSFNEPLKGYSVIFKDPTTVSHIGSLHSGDYSKSEIGAGWYLTANPYSSYVNIEQSVVDAGDWEFANVDKTIYTRTTDNGIRVVAMYNILEPGTGTFGATNYIAPMQAFWISSNGSGTFGVKNAAREHDPASAVLKSTTVPSSDILRINLKNSAARDEMVLAFRDYGSFEVIANDSRKLLQSEKVIPNIYALKQNKQTGIGIFPPVSGSMQIALGHTIWEIAEGVQELSVTNMGEFDPEASVYLEDKLKGVQVDLRVNPVYQFSTGEIDSILVDKSRFVLHISKVSTDTNDEITGIIGDAIIVYTRSNMAVVELSKSFNLTGNDCIVRVFTISGEKIVEKSMSESQLKIALPTHTAYYIVEVEIEGELYHKKILITS